MNSAYTGKLGLYYRNALGFSMGSWPKDLSFLGCHVICSDEKLEPLCSRHSCPGCSGIPASSDSVQKCSHVRIFLRLASTCFVATPCSPLSCTQQPGFFFQAVLPGKRAHLCPHRGGIRTQRCCTGHRNSFPSWSRIPGLWVQ